MGQRHAVIEAMGLRHSLAFRCLPLTACLRSRICPFGSLCSRRAPGSSKCPLPDRVHIFFDTHHAIKTAAPGCLPLISRRTVRCRSAIRDPEQALQPIAFLCQCRTFFAINTRNSILHYQQCAMNHALGRIGSRCRTSGAIARKSWADPTRHRLLEINPGSRKTRFASIPGCYALYARQVPVPTRAPASYRLWRNIHFS